MKTSLTSLFLLTLVLSQRPALASSNDPERPTPSVGVLAGSGIGASPLVRYLAATLQLSPERTRVVQQAVQKHQRLTRTPELLTQCLFKVLTPSEFEQFQQLRENAATASDLRMVAQRKG
ncbi:hypothetical protein GCM10023172_37080 [Hymenobacter ginsengisoli]|uniref:DUF4476 domain-containing protein n=1 Tax=Hymenobacter ginsengisoli TaxID=1051626 RepID=A0ABP8QNZ8_9BACT|nr:MULTISPECIES: hypothetical protein [unclassified Hymenobacter]MBO2032745.1 hypothetical protein [Hymenobacter sp. BT559]